MSAGTNQGVPFTMAGWSVPRSGTTLTRARAAALLVLSLVVLSLLAAQVASAHVERPSYWPDPAPDCSISPCTGGAVPAVRSLSSALDRRRVGDTRVVCRPNSLSLTKRSVARA